MDAVGENIILIREAADASAWQKRVADALEAVIRRYERLTLGLSFDEAFAAGLLEDTCEERKEKGCDKPRIVYTEARLRNALIRYIDNEIAKLIENGSLTIGSELSFTAQNDSPDFVPVIKADIRKGGEQLTPEKVYRILCAAEDDRFSLDELAKDELLHDIYEWALNELLKS